MSDPFAAPQHNSDPIADSLRPEIRGMQIITIAMSFAVLVFTLITLSMSQGAIDGQPDIISWIGVGFAALMFFNHLVIPNIVASAAIKQIDPDRLRNADRNSQMRMLLPACRSRHIIASALLEGAAFLNLVFYMITHFVGNLGAAALLLVLLVLRLPTSSRVTEWARQRIQEFEMR